MYTNVGAKVKTLAKVICILGIIGSVIMGVTMYGNGNMMVIPGLLMIVLGSVLSWASSLALYAFGEMTDNVAAIKKRMEQSEK